jgi:hypothetical protein
MNGTVLVGEAAVAEGVRADVADGVTVSIGEGRGSGVALGEGAAVPVAEAVGVGAADDVGLGVIVPVGSGELVALCPGVVEGSSWENSPGDGSSFAVHSPEIINGQRCSDWPWEGLTAGGCGPG